MVYPIKLSDEHLVLYEDMPEPDVPIHIEEPKNVAHTTDIKKVVQFVEN